jgi:hypothetical protein
MEMFCAGGEEGGLGCGTQHSAFTLQVFALGFWLLVFRYGCTSAEIFPLLAKDARNGAPCEKRGIQVWTWLRGWVVEG